jgi:hypothetical protein
MPSLELSNQEVGDEIMESVLGNGLNLEELKKYIEVAIIVEHRNVNFTMTSDIIKRIIYPFRKCESHDFTSRKFNMSKEFEDQLTYRLCPNITGEDLKNYYIQWLYEN